MNVHDDDGGTGILDGLRKRGFWFFFITVTVVVFVTLMAFDLFLTYFYGKGGPSLDIELVWDTGINLAVGLISAGFAWKYNGEPWINRPDTTKLDLDR